MKKTLDPMIARYGYLTVSTISYRLLFTFIAHFVAPVKPLTQRGHHVRVLGWSGMLTSQ
jgi:hypothetical protein